MSVPWRLWYVCIAQPNGSALSGSQQKQEGPLSSSKGQLCQPWLYHPGMTSGLLWHSDEPS